MMHEEKILETLDQLARDLHQYVSWQRRTATAVTNLSLGLNSAETNHRNDHQQLVGLLLSMLPDAKLSKPPRERRDSDNTDTFKLPGGNELALTRRTQKRVVHLVLVALAFIASHVVAYFVVPHPERPAVTRPPTEVVTGATPRLVPQLAPPRAP